MTETKLSEKLLTEFGPPRFANAFMRDGYRTIGDIVDAIELNGVTLDDGYPEIIGVHPRNTGEVKWAWLFEQLDSIDYNWRERVRRNPWSYRENALRTDISRVAEAIIELGKAYEGLPERLKALIEASALQQIEDNKK